MVSGKEIRPLISQESHRELKKITYAKYKLHKLNLF